MVGSHSLTTNLINKNYGSMLLYSTTVIICLGAMLTVLSTKLIPSYTYVHKTYLISCYKIPNPVDAFSLSVELNHDISRGINTAYLINTLRARYWVGALGNYPRGFYIKLSGTLRTTSLKTVVNLANISIASSISHIVDLGQISSVTSLGISYIQVCLYF